MRRIRLVEVELLLVAALAALPAAASAQSFNGSIVGAVHDSSGAIIPGVALTLRNIKARIKSCRPPSPATMVSMRFGT